MKKIFLYSAIAILDIGLVGCGSTTLSENNTGTHEVHFSYDGDTGPAYWGSLKEEWKTCENGLTLKPVVAGQTHQSPVDFVLAVPVNPSFVLDYNKEIEFKMLNNGHSIELETEGSHLAHVTISGKEYTLKQFHFHSESEHTEDGVHGDMEGHFVNIAADGSIVVLGVIIEASGAGNSELNKVFDLEIPAANHENEIRIHINPSHILPTGKVYSYSGSLTTPPCTQGVSWNVYTTTIGLNVNKIEMFKSHYNHNYRPITGTY